MENLTQKWTQLGPFCFQNKGIFFDLKKRRDAHPLSLVCNLYVWLYMHMAQYDSTMSEYASICLNVTHYA